MKKTLLMVLISGFVLSTSVAWAEQGARGGASTRIVTAAGAHPNAVQKGGSTIAANPAAQARMDASMAANPQANALMKDVQQAGGYTPPAK